MESNALDTGSIFMLANGYSAQIKNALPCNGNNYSKNTYPNLFDRIKYTYGAGIINYEQILFEAVSLKPQVISSTVDILTGDIYQLCSNTGSSDLYMFIYQSNGELIDYFSPSGLTKTTDSNLSFVMNVVNGSVLVKRTYSYYFDWHYSFNKGKSFSMYNSNLSGNNVYNGQCVCNDFILFYSGSWSTSSYNLSLTFFALTKDNMLISYNYAVNTSNGSRDVYRPIGGNDGMCYMSLYFNNTTHGYVFSIENSNLYMTEISNLNIAAITNSANELVYAKVGNYHYIIRDGITYRRGADKTSAFYTASMNISSTILNIRPNGTWHIYRNARSFGNDCALVSIYATAYSLGDTIRAGLLNLNTNSLVYITDPPAIMSDDTTFTVIDNYIISGSKRSDLNDLGFTVPSITSSDMKYYIKT